MDGLASWSIEISWIVFSNISSMGGLRRSGKLWLANRLLFITSHQSYKPLALSVHGQGHSKTSKFSSMSHLVASKPRFIIRCLFMVTQRYLSQKYVFSSLTFWTAFNFCVDSLFLQVTGVYGGTSKVSNLCLMSFKKLHNTFIDTYQSMMGMVLVLEHFYLKKNQILRFIHTFCM